MKHLLLVLAAAGSAAAAQQPVRQPSSAPVAAAPDKKAMAAALDLFDPKLIETQMMGSAMRVAQISIETKVAGLRKRGVELPPSLIERMKSLSLEEVRATVESMTPTFRVKVATIYARYFTVDELHELKRLQGNPVAQKLQRLTPDIVSQITKVALEATEERMPELERKTRAMVEAWLKEQHIMDPGPTS